MLINSYFLSYFIFEIESENSAFGANFRETYSSSHLWMWRKKVSSYHDENQADSLFRSRLTRKCITMTMTTTESKKLLLAFLPCFLEAAHKESEIQTPFLKSTLNFDSIL